jgi:hypothetical protein
MNPNLQQFLFFFYRVYVQRAVADSEICKFESEHTTFPLLSYLVTTKLEEKWSEY